MKDVSILALSLLLTVSVARAALIEPNDDFASRTILAPGVLTCSDTIDGTDDSDSFDFVSFTGLTPGASFTAEIVAADFDTMLAWYDDDGELIEFTDDIYYPDYSVLSRLEGIVPASGLLHLAVTGYPALYADTSAGTPDWFTEEVGAYTLTVTPEPATLALLAIGAAGLLRRKR